VQLPHLRVRPCFPDLHVRHSHPVHY
jgi:hypothetical protein